MNEQNQEDELKPHQQRVVDEQRELDDKIDKLERFINENPTFKSIYPEEQSRLKAQLIPMKEYSNILAQRIANF